MKVDGYNLTMYRGDTEILIVSATLSTGAAWEFITGDTVYFTAMQQGTKNQIQKKIKTFTFEGKAIVELTHADTNNLPTGVYSYDVQVTKADGTVKTVIPPSKLTLLAEVTRE